MRRKGCPCPEAFSELEELARLVEQRDTFPIPADSPFRDNVNALEALLVHDALHAVEANLPEPTHGTTSSSDLPVSGLGSIVGGLALGFLDRAQGWLPHLQPAWATNAHGSPGRLPTQHAVRNSPLQDSESSEPHSHPSESTVSHAEVMHVTTENAFFIKAPKIIGEPSTNLVSDEVQQRYPDTCAVQCQRLILNEFGVGVTEAELTQEAAASGLYHSGNGTSAADVGKLLRGAWRSSQPIRGRQRLQSLE